MWVLEMVDKISKDHLQFRRISLLEGKRSNVGVPSSNEFYRK